MKPTNSMTPDLSPPVAVIKLSKKVVERSEPRGTGEPPRTPRTSRDVGDPIQDIGAALRMSMQDPSFLAAFRRAFPADRH